MQKKKNQRNKIPSPEPINIKNMLFFLFYFFMNIYYSDMQSDAFVLYISDIFLTLSHEYFRLSLKSSKYAFKVAA